MLTARDRQLLHWLGRIGIARTSDLAVRFGIGRTVAYRCVKTLVDYGFVERHRILHHDDGLLVATADGLRYADLDHLPRARVSLPQIHHAIQCAALASTLEPELGDLRMLTDREHRAAEQVGGGPIASAALGRHPNGSPRLHRPDLVIAERDLAGSLIALEVELTLKSKARLEEIMRGYMRNPRIVLVHYYAVPPVAEAVGKAAKRVGAESIIELRNPVT